MIYRVMPNLAADQYAELKADIQNRGVMVPVEFDENGNVLDGHHRLQICKELGITDYPKVIRAGMTEEEKRTHARKLNMARRHLSQEQKRGLIREQLKETPEKSDRQIAESLGVHHTTVSVQRQKLEGAGQVAKLATSTGADGKEYPRQVERKSIPETVPEIKQEPIPARKPVSVFNPTPREERTLRNPAVIEKMSGNKVSVLTAAKQVHTEERQERKTFSLEKELPKDMCRLFTADIKHVSENLEENSIDFIITDPPYPKEYLSLYSDLSNLAQKVLKPGGSLLVMVGQSYLPEVITRLSENMKYHWCLSYLTPGGQSPQLFHKRVNTFWKPVIWLIKDSYSGDYIGDVVKSPVNDNDKRFHEWGQSINGMKDIIERFTNPGDLILDPFLGGGTTGVASVIMGRKFIGTDIEPKNIGISEKRIREEYIHAGSQS